MPIKTKIKPLDAVNGATNLLIVGVIVIAAILGGGLLIHAISQAAADDPSRIADRQISDTTGPKGEDIMTITQLDKHQCVGAIKIATDRPGKDHVIEVNGTRYALTEDTSASQLIATCEAFKAPITVRVVTS